MGWIALIAVLTIAGHLVLAAGTAQRRTAAGQSPGSTRPLTGRPGERTARSRRMTVITADETEHGVWCVPCNAHVAIRVPLRQGDEGDPVTAWLTVCSSCGTRFMPSAPVVTLEHATGRRRPRPLLAAQWRAHRRDCARRGITPTGCAYGECPKPGWWDCAWFEAVEDGRIRWLFCGGRHRDEWLRLNGHAL